MASILRKVGRGLRSDSITKSRFGQDAAPAELSLGDDTDEFTAANSQAGTLSFCEDEEQNKRKDSRSTLIVPFEGDQIGTSERVTFEVTSADKVQDGRSNYVLYTILITRNSGVDRVPAMISKRYSDFDKLNTKLRKKFSTLLEDVNFPKKQIAGNFSSETIARRSRGFEQYLAHIFSLREVRESEELADFFYRKDLHCAFIFLQSQQQSEAILLLEKALPIQEKLLGDFNAGVVRTLCSLVVSYIQVDKLRMAQKYAETALNCLDQDTKDKYLIPLLETSIRLCWEVGKDKQDLEARLNDLKLLGIDTDDILSLEDLMEHELKVV